MEESNIDVNLADMNEVFNNKTFRYRINGFAHACRMNDVGVLGNSGVLFDSNHNDEEGYFISCNKQDSKLGKCVTLSGHYKDLGFTFINYYNKENLDKKIYDLPFSITLEKKVDDETYKFDIMSDVDNKTKFVISKYREFKDRTLRDDVCFYTKTMDFSMVLKLINGFVYNPRLAFIAYNEIMNNYQVVFTNDLIDKMVMQDKALDKPEEDIKKKIKFFLNKITV